MLQGDQSVGPPQDTCLSFVAGVKEKTRGDAVLQSLLECILQKAKTKVCLAQVEWSQHDLFGRNPAQEPLVEVLPSI